MSSSEWGDRRWHGCGETQKSNGVADRQNPLIKIPKPSNRKQKKKDSIGDRRKQRWVRWSTMARLWRDSREQWRSVEERRAWSESQTREKKRVRWREKNGKILNAKATVTMHICTVTVAFMYLCTILHPLMWFFFFFCQNV